MNRRRRPEDIPERLLARLWRNRDWRRRSLHLAGGQRLRVLYPGRPGGGPGPDFRDAILQVDALAPVRGDVEFHRVPRGWREHGHHLDPRYNGVVLHVVARVHGGKPSQRQDGREVPVEIGRNTHQDQRASTMEGLLMETGGLRESTNIGTPMSPSAWCVAGTRPANQPGRRIAGAARLLTRYIDTGLLPGLLPLIAGGTFQDVRRAFTVSGYDGTLIGKGRAVEIVVNVVLPLFHARAVMVQDKTLAARCLYLGERGPRLEENELTREMAALLDLPDRHITVGSFRQQGLMHLYRSLLQMGTPSDGSGLVKETAALYETTQRPLGAVIAESRPWYSVDSGMIAA